MPEETNKPETQNPVGWFEIYVQDLPRAQAFYESVFQTKLEPLPNPATEGPSIEMLAFPMIEKTPGSPGAIVKMEGAPSGPGGTLVYFYCEDCSEEAARVAEFGGAIARPKFPIGEYGFIALATDPDGNMIGLHSNR